MNIHLARLNRDLKRKGERIKLRRYAGTNTQIFTEVELVAFVRGYSPQELAAGSGIQAVDSFVILSPTDLFAAQWPGGQQPLEPPFNPDPHLPRKGDRAIIQGRTRIVEVASPIYDGDELVRIEMRVLG